MLDDAEKRHAVKRDTEKLWLEQLQDKYYEMDDVLDTWSTARIKAEIEKEEGKPADITAPAVVKKKGRPSNPETLPNRHLRRSVTVLKPDSGRSSGSKHKEDDDEGDF
ncbi:hypothetical protein CMV_026295 [Castanea mollissima]|uniref:Disease resistance N-terminal domain-containing protein n=1 Tax=Castanea mollissima TaxID=60419 RepID=A0A8J4VAJ5_9ROSI|nr:hypothetical protein CMV_026295 [Castanea mollissima]